MPEFNLSEEIQHYRNLVGQGKISAEDAVLMTDWLQKVSSFVVQTGKSFAEIAATIPCPLPWKGFTNEDGGSEVQAPKSFTVHPEGTELEF